MKKEYMIFKRVEEDTLAELVNMNPNLFYEIHDLIEEEDIDIDLLLDFLNPDYDCDRFIAYEYDEIKDKINDRGFIEVVDDEKKTYFCVTRVKI